MSQSKVAVELNGEIIIEFVGSYRFLGSFFRGAEGALEDVKLRVGVGLKPFYALKIYVYIRNVSLNEKRDLYGRGVAPSATFGTQIWGMKKDRDTN